MLLSRSAQYSLRALLYLAAQPEDRFVMTRDVAFVLGLPPHFLAKLMVPMTRKGWLRAYRGRYGGIALTEQARRLNLLQIIENLDEHPERRHDCLLGLKACDDSTACVLHCQWQPIKRELLDSLARRNLVEIAAEDDIDRLIGRLGGAA